MMTMMTNHNITYNDHLRSTNITVELELYLYAYGFLRVLPGATKVNL